MTETIAWETVAEGIVLPVQAQAGARRNGIQGIRQGRLIVAVTQAPEKGKANAAILDVLVEVLHVKKRQIALINGETNRSKRFMITDVSASDLEQRLKAVLQGLSN